MQIKKYLNKLFEITLIILLVLAFAWFYDNIYFPSKLSILSSCQIINETELSEFGYELAGYYNFTSNEIVILKETPTVNKHENCHRVQDLQNRTHYCNERFWMMMNELECKTSEYYPEFMYNWKYL